MCLAVWIFGVSTPDLTHMLIRLYNHITSCSINYPEQFSTCALPLLDKGRSLRALYREGKIAMLSVMLMPQPISRHTHVICCLNSAPLSSQCDSLLTWQIYIILWSPCQFQAYQFLFLSFSMQHRDLTY